MGRLDSGAWYVFLGRMLSMHEKQNLFELVLQALGCLRTAFILTLCWLHLLHLAAPEILAHLTCMRLPRLV